MSIRPGATQAKYWIDPQQLRVIRGQVFENDVLVREFSIQEVKENVGLSDDFFSF